MVRPSHGPTFVFNKTKTDSPAVKIRELEPPENPQKSTDAEAEKRLE
jgi:hypothetical protein